MTFHFEDPIERGANSSPNLSRSTQQKNSVRCSLCGKTFDRETTKNFPFCSPRCRQIDLGNWLGESYGLPIETGEFGDADYDEED